MAKYSTSCCFKHPAEFADKQGILRLHAVSVQRAGSKTIVRLPLAEWNQEVEVCCFLAWVKLDGKHISNVFCSRLISDSDLPIMYNWI